MVRIPGFHPGDPGSSPGIGTFLDLDYCCRRLLWVGFGKKKEMANACISGLVVEYIVAIDVTRVRFPADARFLDAEGVSKTLRKILVVWRLSDVV